jgi:hypothetical protein
MHGDIINMQKILVRKAEVWRPLGRLRRNFRAKKILK